MASSSTLTDLRIRDRLPYPIAVAWDRLRVAQGGVAHAQQLIGAFDVTLRTLAALLLADYLRGPADREVEKLLPHLEKPSLGHWRGLVHHLLRAAATRPDAFYPEACAWHFDPVGRPTAAARLLDELLQLRNADAHGRARSAHEMNPFIGEFEDKLRALLGGARWLRGYRLVRVRDPKPTRLGTKRGDRGRLQVYAGQAERGRVEDATWQVDLFEELLYAVSPDGKRLLEVSPFLEVHVDPGVADDRVFLLARAPKGKTLELVHDATGRKESVKPSLGDRPMPFDAWLAARDHLPRALDNPTPGPFASLDDVAAGVMLGEQYRVVDVLGAGAMATVYVVEDLWNEREVALKVLSEEGSRDPSLEHRFRRERRLMCRLGHQHRHILEVYDLDQLPDGRWAVAMPVVHGGSLKDRLRDGPLPPDRVLAWARQALDALGFLHAEGVAHRDVKPSNLLLGADDALLLADFGIAHDDADTLQLTAIGERLGTQPYMAPEVLDGTVASWAAADLYSLAVTLHELAAGRLPKGPPGKGLDGLLGALVRCLGSTDPAARDGWRALLEAPAPAATPEPRGVPRVEAVRVEPARAPAAPPPQAMAIPAFIREAYERLGVPPWVEIPAGRFVMGSTGDDPEAYPDERPAHEVTLTRPLLVWSTPMIQAVYEALMEENPSRFKGADRPVERVTWYDAAACCNALSRVTGLDEAYVLDGDDALWKGLDHPGWRLPTEAEWEYACRAGTRTPRYGALEDIAWFSGNARDGTQPVGGLRPNAWGLYDTLGNVFEWCTDGLRAYDDDPATDPVGPLDGGSYRVCRGGSWYDDARYAPAAVRLGNSPSSRCDNLGFRPVRSLP